MKLTENLIDGDIEFSSYFLDACVVNSFILFQLRSQSNSSGLTLKEFRLIAAKGLIGVPEPAKHGGPSNERPSNKFKKIVGRATNEGMSYANKIHIPKMC